VILYHKKFSKKIKKMLDKLEVEWYNIFRVKEELLKKLPIENKNKLKGVFLL
jgi:arsenate reductase-like glutaredoxin family protein